ncbi:MAG: type II toxin-antitoxin system VapC family toxin [Syntrophobacteraceae bacterium]|nr:type II toxin-antitoxin system VapC family toxin [Syntrophobacteraceae bacterium]
MKLLLDTHIWLWSSLEPERLSQEIFSELENSRNELWISPISLWETVVLAEKGRIILRPDPETWVRTALSKAPMKEAPINTEVALLSRKIRLPHPDPSDRFLAATASVFGLTLVTEDIKLHKIKGVQILSTRHAATR